MTLMSQSWTASWSLAEVSWDYMRGFLLALLLMLCVVMHYHIILPGVSTYCTSNSITLIHFCHVFCGNMSAAFYYIER